MAARPRLVPPETSHPGVFVAGDLRPDYVKRVALGRSQGALTTSLVTLPGYANGSDGIETRKQRSSERLQLLPRLAGVRAWLPAPT
jgi:hypothetical protein